MKPRGEKLQLSIELSGDASRCESCSGTIDAEMVRAWLDNLLREAQHGGWAIEQARLQLKLRRLCHRCLLDGKTGGAKTPLPQGDLFAQRQIEIARYFGESDAFIEGNELLREPQIAAYRALLKYFGDGFDAAKKNAPAIVEIPTGCGKTGIICTVPFGLSRGRVLIIAPNLTIKQSVVKSLSIGDAKALSDNFFLKCRVFERLESLPNFSVLDRHSANREDCLRAEVVVTNIQQMATWLKYFEPDFFDLIIIDEAHHEPADSWQRVAEHFPQAKRVLLTATPFRCDNKSIVGSTVYRYRMAQAIRARYVKNVMKLDAVASQMTFTVHDETRELSYDEIMAMREEGWFSKGVALSPLCNATIVERSILIWKEKCKSGVRHQIIGAACSIRHAQQIVELFQERGLRCTHVASEGMNFEERTRRIRDYESGDYDCLVHVGILGEGYDHPNISICAIFRPYRSLSPYAQFVGRALRWIGGCADRDNLAHIVSHSGLNLNFLWEYFKHETRENAIGAYLDQLFWNDDAPSDETVESDEWDFEHEELRAEVTHEIIEGFDVDTFLPVEDDTLKFTSPTVRRVDAFAATIKGRGFRNYGKTQDRARRMDKFREQARERGGTSPDQSTLRRRPPPYESTLPLPFNRPDLERGQHRLLLNKEVQRAAGFVMWMLKLPPDDSRVPLIVVPTETKVEAKPQSLPRSNYEATISALQRSVNRAMHKDETGSNRNDWTIAELRQARVLVREVRQTLIKDLRRRIQEEEQIALPFE